MSSQGAALNNLVPLHAQTTKCPTSQTVNEKKKKTVNIVNEKIGEKNR